jgi:hypothetical protein
MKTAKKPKAKAAAVKPKTQYLNNVNVDYVQKICDESIATIMALNALVRQLADRLEDRK